MNLHDETEICVVQNDYVDSFNPDRVSFYGVGSWPTIVSEGVLDAWPDTCLEADYQLNAPVPSPMTIAIVQNNVGDFTATLTAEEDILDADFFMVATLDEYVQCYGGGTSHLQHHVKVHLTPPTTGDPFTLLAGQSIDINHTFEVQSDWDYQAMGVAAWVSRPGGTAYSPSCNQGFPLTLNEVLQAQWVPTGDLAAAPEPMLTEIPSLRIYPNPGVGSRTITYTLPHSGRAQLGIYDAQGRLIEKLAARNDAGTHKFTWSPSESRDGQAGSQTGICFMRLEFDGQVITKELLLIQ